MAHRSAPYAHRAHYGTSKQAVVECLEANMREELTLRDVARLARVSKLTAERVLRELRDEGLAHSRQSITLDNRPLLWSRCAI